MDQEGPQQCLCRFKRTRSLKGLLLPGLCLPTFGEMSQKNLPVLGKLLYFVGRFLWMAYGCTHVSILLNLTGG